MDWIVFLFALELGIVPTSGFVMYDTPSETVFEQAGYVQLETRIELFKYLFLGGSIRTYVWKDREGVSFWPWRDGYMFNAGLRYKQMELGFRHYCTHPVIPYRYPAKMNWEGAYEEVYFRIESK